MNGALVELDSVTKSYEQGSSKVHALTDVSLAVAEGEMVVLLGPSGSGKTTLLTVVGTIDPACSTTFWRRSD